MKHNFLFSAGYWDLKSSLLILFLRLSFGCMLLTHGVYKWSHFGTLKDDFPDPLHVGSFVSLCLAIFAEVFCCLGFITGCLYRLALIPMMFTMFMVVFIVNAGQPFSSRELAMLYLCSFIVCFVTGPGGISVDRFFWKKV